MVRFASIVLMACLLAASLPVLGETTIAAPEASGGPTDGRPSQEADDSDRAGHHSRLHPSPQTSRQVRETPQDHRTTHPDKGDLTYDCCEPRRCQREWTRGETSNASLAEIAPEQPKIRHDETERRVDRDQSRRDRGEPRDDLRRFSKLVNEHNAP
jgi:hypothetical protein